MKSTVFYIVLVSLFSCSFNVSNKKEEARAESKIDQDDNRLTEFEIIVKKYFKGVDQPVDYKDWTYLFDNIDDIESIHINMDEINSLNVSYNDPNIFSDFVAGIGEPVSKDWFYPENVGDLNYLVNKVFFYPLFYLKVDNLYVLGIMSAAVDDNGVYPYIYLKIYDNNGELLNKNQDIYLLRQMAFEGNSNKITSVIFENKLISKAIINGYYDEDNYEKPFERCIEYVYRLQDSSFNKISEKIIYEK